MTAENLISNLPFTGVRASLAMIPSKPTIMEGTMAQTRESPYIWVTWLTKLLVGENSCEWAAWFHAHHESWSYDKVPSNFDANEWQMKHTALLKTIRIGG